MKKLLLIVLFVCSSSVISSGAFANTILVLGDSISAAYRIPVESGWVSLLQERLNSHKPGHYTVVNASISGDTTAGGLNRLPPLLEKHKPDQVIVELGGNDGLRGLPLAGMRDNLQAIIDLSRQQGADVVLVSIELPTSYGSHFNQRFLQVFDELEKANDIPRVSLGFKLLNDRNLIQEDGIHPTAEAQPLLLDVMWPVIAPVVGQEG